jgi:aminoglycoside phosphotransferase (APT) family kinase protein
MPPASIPTRGADTEVASLGRVLGGEVLDLHRVSGGASRVTSSFDLLAADGSRRALILQQDRGPGIAGPGRVRVEVALLRAAAAAGVPVPGVVALGVDEADGLGPGWVVVERIEGETIPRKILRDPEWAAARSALTAQCAQALAAVHAIAVDRMEGLAQGDVLDDPLTYLDGLGETRPALEFGARWLAANRPAPVRRVAVHGDFRLGNLLVGPEGLRAVLDWELAHAGDPAEDLGWLCAPAWRFGGPGAVGGFGEIEELLQAYAAAGGESIEPARLTWWIVYATVKWAVICAMQAASHLRGATRSVELAAIGRRVCESEWDLFVLLGLAPDPAEAGEAGEGDAPGGSDAVPAPFGRPTAVELVEAVREYLEAGVMAQGESVGRYQGRVARNALSVVERELRLGPALAQAHAARLHALGYADDRALADAIRAGDCDADWAAVGSALAASARDQLLVANPAYLPPASA